MINNLETLKKQRYRGNSPYKFTKSNTGRVLYLPLEVRQTEVNQHQLSTLSTKIHDPRAVNKVKRNSGNGFHSKSRYWSAGSQLKNINDQRHKVRLEKEAKENARKVFQEERVRSVRTLNDDPPRRKFRGFGYSEPLTIEVTPAPMNQEPRFKHKIEEFIHIAKQKSY